MSTKTYIINSYDPATRQIERVTVTREVYHVCRRTEWNIAKSQESFFKHEIQMTSLIGGENGGYENFREFIVDHDEVDRIVAERLLRDALYRALNALSEKDCDLIRAIYFDGKTLEEYAAETQVSASAVCQRRRTVLRELKIFLKNFHDCPKKNADIFPYTSEKKLTLLS